MPHDIKGNLIEAGDIVKGRGYNIKHDIIAEVLQVTPDSDACNIQLAVCHVKPISYGNAGTVYTNGIGPAVPRLLVPGVEYGACKDFEIIKKAEKTA